MVTIAYDLLKRLKEREKRRRATQRLIVVNNPTEGLEAYRLDVVDGVTIEVGTRNTITSPSAASP